MNEISDDSDSSPGPDCLSTNEREDPQESQTPILSMPSIRPFLDTVAGHDDLLSVEGNDMLIKPTTQMEIDFYEESHLNHPEFSEFLPMYYGTMRQHSGVANQDELSSVVGNVLETSSAPGQKQYLCFENITAGFVSPCIIDIKIGTRLYDDFADAAKVAKMKFKASQTTSLSLGVRICGLRVFKKQESDEKEQSGTEKSEPGCNCCNYSFIKRSQDYCRKLDAKELTEELELFFGPVSDSDWAHQYRSFLIESIIYDLKTYLEICSSMDLRMYSSSLLLVYESDMHRVAQLNSHLELFNTSDPSFVPLPSLEQDNEENPWDYSSKKKSDKCDSQSEYTQNQLFNNTSSSTQMLSSAQVQSENMAIKISSSENYQNISSCLSSSPTSSSSSSLSSSAQKLTLYDLRSIDFAHSIHTPGQGPDTQYIFGLENLIGIIEGLQ
ncbi:hypothetical protein BB560_002899 [Smittium megazygosporum]|uniref:Kinase n=1 Tax=Smittium megazygosporum TaxID=133381 RepID=A0A2T9ZDG7_9FUNG|nr:hypothetical protein BB560_002899 [Smittium megazygosporum]